MSLGTVVRTRRKELGRTQDQISEVVGISKPYLSNIETGSVDNPPTDGVLIALEKALGFQGGELIRMAHRAKTPPDVLQDYELLETEVQKLRNVLKELMEGSNGPAVTDAIAQQTGADLGSFFGPKVTNNIGRLSAGVAVPVINRVSGGYPHTFTNLDRPPSVADEYIRCPDVHDGQAFAARVVGDSMEPTYHEGDFVIFSPNTAVRSGDDCFVRFDADGGTTFKRFYQDSPDIIRLQPLNSKYPAQSHPAKEVTGLWPAVFRIEKLR